MNPQRRASWVISFLMHIVASRGVVAWSSSFVGFQSHIRPPSHQQKQLRSQSTILVMGMQVKIRIVGRSPKGEWLEDAYDMYATRLRASPVDIETVWHKNDADLIKGVNSDLDKNHAVILLDLKGKQCTSEAFAEQLFEWLNLGGSRCSFVIGGAEGLPPELLNQKGLLRLKLSDMTFTHQFARIMLTEQIYRATEIRKGSGYHK